MNIEDYVVTGDDLVAEVVNLYPEAAEYMAELGLGCVGCSSAEFETLWDACHTHGLNAVKTLDEINRRILGE